MSCDVNLLFTRYDEDARETKQTSVEIGKVENGDNVNIDTIVNLIMNLDGNTRQVIYDNIIQRKVQILDPQMVNSHRLISNTTIEDLMNHYGFKMEDYHVNYKSLSKVNLLNVAHYELTGRRYSGRLISDDGTEYFVISNAQELSKFLGYCERKQKIDKIFAQENLPQYLKRFQKDLELITKHVNDNIDQVNEALKSANEKNTKNKTGKKIHKLKSHYTTYDIIIDYLNYRSQYLPFKTSDGQTILQDRVLAEFVNAVIPEYGYGRGLSDLALSLTNLIEYANAEKTSGNITYYQISRSRLYNLLAIHIKGFSDTYTFDQFKRLSIDDLNELFYNEENGLFYGDSMLMNFVLYKADQRVEIIKPKEETTKKKTIISKAKEMPNLWPEIRKFAEAAQIELPEKFSQFEDKKVELETLVKKFNKINFTLSNDTGELHEVKAEIVTRGDKKSIQYGYTEEIKNEDIEVAHNAPLIFRMHYGKADTLFNFAYDTQSPVMPVTNEFVTVDGKKIEITDGIYKGYYIYKITREPTIFGNKTQRTIYGVSKNIISTTTYLTPYATLEGAVRKIDRLYETTKIVDHPLLYLLYKNESNEQKRTIDTNDIISNHQVITSIKLALPYYAIQTLPASFRELLHCTVPQFQEKLKGITEISKLNTTQKCAAFVILAYDYLLKNFSKSPDWNDNCSNIAKLTNMLNDKSHKNYMDQYVSQIDNAGLRSYYVTDIVNKKGVNTETREQIANLKPIYDGNNELDLSGRKVGSKDASAFVKTTLDLTIEHFKENYGVNIEAVNKSRLALNETIPNTDIKLGDALRTENACIIDGTIYINLSKADVSDLIHEITHIYLGLLKTQDMNLYEEFIDKIRNDKKYKRYFQSSFEYIRRHHLYKNLARTDQIEEAICETLGRAMKNDHFLFSNTFNDTRFADLMDTVVNRLRENTPEKVDNQLGFIDFMKSSESNKNDLKTYRQITHLIEMGIKGENDKYNIIENC